MPSDQNIASRYVQRKVLLSSAVLLAVFFAVTAAVARAYHVRQQGLVNEWFQRGNFDLNRNQPALALEDFRNALSYGPDNHFVELRLAEALLAAGRLAEARSYLDTLWEGSPGSGEVNLDLAQVSIEQKDVDEASRYLRSAIFGSWEKDAAGQRRNARLELCNLLLSNDRIYEAKAEIAGLAADTPPGDAPQRIVIARLFTRAGEPAQALAEYEAGLRSQPRNEDWLAEAGEAAYQAGDYLKSEMYLSKADREGPSRAVQSRLALVRHVLGDDPFLTGLSEDERAQRSWRDLNQALDRLQNCSQAAGSSLPAQVASQVRTLNQQAQDLRKRATLRTFRRSADAREEAMRFVFHVETVLPQNCGSPTQMDEALVLIQKRHEGMAQ
jgi:tetratricopeptide (TPR) repeat protein